MSLLRVKHVFGVMTSLKNSLFYLNEHSYLYLSNRHLIIYNNEYQSQRLINYENELECLIVSPNKEYLAMALKSSEKCRIVIEYLNNSSRRGKILCLNDSIQSNDILSLLFSSNSKVLLSFHGAPDYLLICWSIDRSISLSSISLRSHFRENFSNIQLSFPPNDSSKVLITGDHFFRYYTLNNNRFSINEEEGECYRCQSMNILCHSWINEKEIFLGLQTGWIVRVNQHGDILEELNIKNVEQSSTNLSRSQFSSIFLSKKKPSIKITNPILSLLTFSRGLLVATSEGSLVIFERSVNSNEYIYLRRLILPSLNMNIKTKKKRNDSSSNISEKAISNELIRSMVFSPNEETLLVGTNFNHLYQISFSKIDNNRKDEGNVFQLCIPSAHRGRILMARECLRKSLLFTIGIDRVLKGWNLQTNSEELSHEFVSDPLTFSVHPNGIFLCISFEKMIEMYIYTIEGLNLFKQISIPSIRCIEYSFGGHLLFIASENLLQFHNHNDYDQIRYTQTEKKKFRLIRWSSDDTFVISVDSDHWIIQWNPYTGERISEFQIGQFTIEDLFISIDHKFSYLLCNDQKMKIFEMFNNIVDMDIGFDDCIPRSFTINEKSEELFIGSEKGSIYRRNFNGNDTRCQMNVHQGSINQLLIFFNENLLISTGDDGNIILYDLKEKEGNEQSSNAFRDQILGKEILFKEQNIRLNLLRKNEYEMIKEYENLIGKKEEEYISHLSEVDFHCQKEISSMQMKLKEFQEEKSRLRNEQTEKFKDLIEEKERRITKWKDQKKKHYEEILFRDQIVQFEMKDLNQIQYQKIELIKNEHQRNVQLIQLSYHKRSEKIEQIFFQKGIHINEDIGYLEEMKDLFNEQTELELTNVKESSEKRLQILLNEIEELENEEIVLKRRIEEIEYEGNDFDHQMKDLSTKRTDLIDQIRTIDENLNLTKQTIEQRHLIIEEKLKQTNEMEIRRDELEKFAYVFNYKIRELTNELVPREHELQALIEQLNNMNKEYQRLIERNSKYSIQISDYRGRLKALEKDLYHQIFNIRRLNEISANIKEDFSHLIDQPKKLIQFIGVIYGKYILQKNSSSEKLFDSTQKNFFDSDRERNYFEGTNQRLKKKISLDLKREKIEDIRRIEEQISLMREISSYSMKVIQLQRILTDLNVLSSLPIKTREISTKELLQILKVEQGEEFLQEKQKELQIIFIKQEKRLEQLRNLLFKLDEHLQQSPIELIADNTNLLR